MRESTKIGDMFARHIITVCCLLGLIGASTDGWAEARLRWRGFVQADLRLNGTKEASFERLEGKADVTLQARLSRHVRAAGNLRLFFTERANPGDFMGLTDRTRLDPYRLESDALYVEFVDIGLRGFDIRIGRQQLIWGSADRFHVVSNLNPLDVEDPIQFGRVIANEMLVMRYRPEFHFGNEDEPWFEEFGIELAFVPFFKPAQLPESAGLGFTDPAEQERRANTTLLKKLIAQQKALMNAGWTVDTHPSVALPSRDLKNGMFGARMSWRLLGMDMGFSYFSGYDDFPRGELVTADVNVTHVDSRVMLTYPRVQVVGFDMATSLEFLGGLGLWGEVALTIHEDLYRVVATGPVLGVNEVERELEKGSFVKAVIGMDYTPISWMYINVQYLYGFLDEFGSGNLQNYLVAGIDFKLARDKLLIRTFSIVNLDDGSFVLFPAIQLKAWSGGSLLLGAFLYSSILPDSDPAKKFESPAAGKSNFFLQARANF